MDNILVLPIQHFMILLMKLWTNWKQIQSLDNMPLFGPQSTQGYLLSQTEHLENIGITLEPIPGMIKLLPLDHMSQLFFTCLNWEQHSNIIQVLWYSSVGIFCFIVLMDRRVGIGTTMYLSSKKISFKDWECSYLDGLSLLYSCKYIYLYFRSTVRQAKKLYKNAILCKVLICVCNE